MDHWHVGRNTPGDDPESDTECFAEIREAAWAFHTALQKAIDALPVPDGDEQYMQHLEWLHPRDVDRLTLELAEQRWLRREVHDGHARPTVYWVSDAEGDLNDCELQQGGVPR
jgi:hypothetical protein